MFAKIKAGFLLFDSLLIHVDIIKMELNFKPKMVGSSLMDLWHSKTHKHSSLTRCMSILTITRALWHIAGPGSIDCTVSCQQTGRIVALSASVGNGFGKGQPIMDQDLGVSWSSRVSTGDHWKQEQPQQGHQQLFTQIDFSLPLFCNCSFFVL